MLGQKADVNIRNCAVPGATSADVARFFLTEVPAKSFDCVIAYLGNNEGAGGGPKGRFSPMRARIHSVFGKKSQRLFRPVLSPRRFEFEHDVKAPIIAATPAEFGHNLRLIARHATKTGARFILLNPVANERFPSGLGSPNSGYFSYLDELDRLGHVNELNPTDPASRVLAKGLMHFVLEKFDEAIDVWKPLTTQGGIAGFVASHNVACARSRNGDDGAEAVIIQLLGAQPAYDALLLYNLAQLSRLRGDIPTMTARLDLAYETDLPSIASSAHIAT